MAAMLTRKVRVYSMKVIAAFTLTAQLPNSSSLKPLPPEPAADTPEPEQDAVETEAPLDSPIAQPELPGQDPAVLGKPVRVAGEGR